MIFFTADADVRVPSVGNAELTYWYVLLWKPGEGQNMAMHASPTARNFFLVLISTFPVHSPSWQIVVSCCVSNILILKLTGSVPLAFLFVWTHNFDEDLDFSNQFFGFGWFLYIIEHVWTNVFRVAIKWHEQGLGSICHCVYCVTSKEVLVVFPHLGFEDQPTASPCGTVVRQTTDLVGHWGVFTLGSTGRGLVQILCCGNVYINRYKMSHHSWLLLIIIDFHHHVQNLIHCVVSGFIQVNWKPTFFQFACKQTLQQHHVWTRMSYLSLRTLFTGVPACPSMAALPEQALLEWCCRADSFGQQKMSTQLSAQLFCPQWNLLPLLISQYCRPV